MENQHFGAVVWRYTDLDDQRESFGFKRIMVSGAPGIVKLLLVGCIRSDLRSSNDRDEKSDTKEQVRRAHAQSDWRFRSRAMLHNSGFGRDAQSMKQRTTLSGGARSARTRAATGTFGCVARGDAGPRARHPCHPRSSAVS